MRMYLYLFGLALIVPIAAADETTSHQIYAKPVERTAPRYPSSELRRGQQGWVELNYVVTEEGEVIEPVVEASSGSHAFERAAIKTVERWRYEPALLNGEPIQQCRTAVRISFALENSQTGVSKRFHKKYKKIDKAIDRGDIDSASSELENTFLSKGLTLGELSWLWTLQARIAGMQDDKEKQLIAVRRALAVSSGWVPDTMRAGLLKSRMVLEIQKNNFAEALDAYSELKSMESANTSELDPIVESIQAFVESDQLLFSEAEIGNNGNCESCASQWRYRPMRRAIEITDIDGTLGNIELRCEWQRFVDEARESVAWNIPASWGECSVVVHGETGSTFKLVELPDS